MNMRLKKKKVQDTLNEVSALLPECKLKKILGVETIDFLLEQEVNDSPDSDPAEKNNS